MRDPPTPHFYNHVNANYWCITNPIRSIVSERSLAKRPSQGGFPGRDALGAHLGDVSSLSDYSPSEIPTPKELTIKNILHLNCSLVNITHNCRFDKGSGTSLSQISDTQTFKTPRNLFSLSFCERWAYVGSLCQRYGCWGEARNHPMWKLLTTYGILITSNKNGKRQMPSNAKYVG